MKVVMNLEGKRTFKIPVPLVLAPWGLELVLKNRKKWIKDDQATEVLDMVAQLPVKQMLKEVRQIAKEYKGLAIVSIKDKDGTMIQVIL